jgi:hypothetical protein
MHRPILAVPARLQPPPGAPCRALATPPGFCHDPALGWWIKGLVAMGLKRCLLACVLALAGVGSAAAMDAGSRDPTNPHATIDSGSRDGSGGSDASDASRDCPLPGTGGESSDSGDGGSLGPTPRPRASHRSSLSWQSLLPGSIQ